MSNSPIDELFGNEMDYLKRGLSQLELILACKEKRLNQLTEENNNLKMFARKLQEIITTLQIKLEQAQPTVRMSDLENENEKSMNNFLSTL
jgi:CII-binding regulator of phage lambda lysogenization HflD